jgi:hypothetical protein
MEKKLKVYKLQVDPSIADDTGVDCISLVNDPAIMKNFVAFNADGAKRLKFTVTDEARQIVTGPIMVPDLPIYRNEKDADGKVADEWYVVADKDTIAAVIQKFFKTQRSANTSLEHNGFLLNGVYIIESFQVDYKRGINPPTGYGTIPDGTWFGSMKVESPEIWSQIKAGTFNGFSVEGLFTYKETASTLAKGSDVKKISALAHFLK